MDSMLSTPRAPRIAEQAAQWLEVLQRGGAEERKAFAVWLTESRRHVEEFLFMTAVDRVLEDVDPQQRIDVEHLLTQGAGKVVPLPAERAAAVSAGVDRVEPAGMRRRSVMALTALAAGCAAVAVAAWGLLAGTGWEDYSTVAGEQRTVELEDGSLVYINTLSQLQVRFSETGRDLRLLQGEAMFSVERDPLRPFRVDTGSAVIQAVGTRFNVQRRSRQTTVSVLEGAVRISTEAQTQEEGELVAGPQQSVPDSGMLQAGEEASIVVNGRITRRPIAEVARVEAWRERRLMFRADTLQDIAESFNRYNRSPRIRIEGEQIAARRFTGVFDANDPESLVAFLGAYADLAVDESGDELVVRMK